ncbi:MarR family transcriptional regulator [Microbacterium deminutum]|uniref:HTH marR-type domain-containing protein n=1 Tax=Microbacterium deminutum TaxID=344164 RepID=A0ABP5CRB2_9MICO
MTSVTEQLNTLFTSIAFAGRASADDWVRDSGLTRQQGFALRYIEENQHRDVIARELAVVSGTTPASVASLLQGLEDRGYITRTPSPDDSRVKLLAITAAGSDLIEGFDEAVSAAQVRLFSGLSPAEQEQLVTLLERIIETAGVPVMAAPPRRGGSPSGRRGPGGR